MKNKLDGVISLLVLLLSIVIYVVGIKLELLGFAIGILLAGVIKSFLKGKIELNYILIAIVILLKCFIEYKGIIYISDGLFIFLLGVVLLIFESKQWQSKRKIQLYSLLAILLVIGVFSKNIVENTRMMEDYSLNKIVKREMDRRQLSYEEENLLKIERLYIDRYDKVTSIDDIDKLLNLKELGINYKGYYDFSKLQDLKNLQSIMLEHSKLSDLGFLRDLKGIKEIEFWDCDFDDYSIFDNIQEYEELSIAKFDIYDISFLSKGKNIKKLHLYNGYIKDTSFFKDMESLEELSIQYVSTNNIDFINEIPNLKKVKIYSNNIVEGIDKEKIKDGIEVELINQ